MKNFKILTTGFFLFLFIFNCNTYSQTAGIWKNHKCAVALTYDDGLNVQLDNVIPALDSLGLKGTFYVPGYSSSFIKRFDEWKAIVKNGHELGNHTLFHPCIGPSQGRNWVSRDYDLDNYSTKRILEEIRVANVLLRATDGKTLRTYAYTCGDSTIGGISFVDSIRNDFISARGGGENIYNRLGKIDLFNINSYCIDGNTAADLIKMIKEALEKDALIVFMFHGVGGEHSLNIANNEHKKFLTFLKQNRKDIWIAPLLDISVYIRDYQSKQTGNRK